MSVSLLKRIWKILIYSLAAVGFALIVGYAAVQFGWTNAKGIVDSQHNYFQNQRNVDSTWNSGEEWIALKEAILKDTQAINRASKESRIPSRMIVAPLIVEQLRLFHSEREVFKTIFGPLRILGNQSQFSWGVMGIKQDTARNIEKNLIDRTSPWYIGAEYSHILDYQATSTENSRDSERFARLTDENDRYYSYLYGALYMKEIMAQWSRAGITIDQKTQKTPENIGIIATLYNIGFNNSKPHENPQIGGAEIEIRGHTYSFGGLAQDFYDSNELIDAFPR